MEKNCENCRFWKQKSKDKSGECHCKAPLPYIYCSKEKTLNSGTRWPLTDRYQSCGEFKDKEPIVGC